MPEVPRKHFTEGCDAPGYKCAVVTPSNSADLTQDARFLRINAAGNIRFTPSGNADGDYVTWTVTEGEYIPMRVKRVYATGTTVAAGNIFACW